ncbi:MAG: tetratricopeptide repeat protein [Bacteroidota bacterium]
MWNLRWKNGLLSLGMILLSFSLPAQVLEDAYFRTEVDKGIFKVYNFQFEAAHQDFSRLKTKYAHHPAPYFLLALNRWWQSYITSSDVYHDFIEKNLDKALELNEVFEHNKAYRVEYTFFQYMCYAFHTRLAIEKKEWFTAANYGRKALPYLEAGFQMTQETPEFFFSSGIYHYYAETYPEQHLYVRPFMVFFPDGDAHLGLQELTKAAGTPNFSQTEAAFYLGDIYLENPQHYAQALRIKQELVEKYPRNTWFLADYGRALVIAGHFEKGGEILAGMAEKFEKISGSHDRQIDSRESTLTSLCMMRVYHYLGREAMEHQHQYQAAIQYFDRSLKMAQLAGLEEEGHLPANQYYRGRCLERINQPSQAIEAYEKVLDMDENEAVAALATQRLASLRR